MPNSPIAFGSWEEHGRGLLETCERLQRDLSKLEHSSDEQVRDVRHRLGQSLQMITTHIELCKQRERVEEQFKNHLTRLFADIASHRESDLDGIKRDRAADLTAINRTLAEINLTITQKTAATNKLLWAGIIAWAGSATGGLIWTLGKLLHLI